MASGKFTCGLNLNCITDLRSALETSVGCGFQYIVGPIVHPRLYREFIKGKAKNRDGFFTRPDLVITTQDWNSLVVGRISPWIQMESPIEHIRKNSEKALEQELNYASHLGLPAVIIPIRNANCVNLARVIYDKLQAIAGYQGIFHVWAQVPMQAPCDVSLQYLKDPETMETNEGAPRNGTDTWEWWNTFRNICGPEKQVGIALELGADISDNEELTRWLGEPLRCLLISTSLFCTNKKGYPVLPRPHQDFIRKAFKLDCQIVISGANRHEHIKHYFQYIEHLWNTQTPPDPVTQYARGYEDCLQIPLQPLMDNLESSTYEIFEKDPIKYTEYQRAIQLALQDRVPEEEKETSVCVVMVVGAGRGPLVQATLSAAETAQRKVKVYAVEKNPNAVVTLCSHRSDEWQDRVTVVSCDMRDWKAPEKADILVSELLGSFADNELSPECLDGAQKFLKDDGISIPCSYTSYLSPLQSSKLYTEVSQIKEKDKPHYSSFEMPYVVRLHNRTELAPPQTVFTFHHPNRDGNDNSRYKCLNYKIKMGCVLHGFAGYFDTCLYKDITLSIVPETHSVGMFSWFPIFFPLREPLNLLADSEVEVHFWRCANRRNVWYEWCVTKPFASPVHNPNGRSYTIGL